MTSPAPIDYKELIKRTAALCGYGKDIAFSERKLDLSGTGVLKWNFFTSVFTSLNHALPVVECENNRALAEQYIEDCKRDLPENPQSYTGFLEEVAKHEEHDFQYLAAFSIQRNILTSFTGQSAHYFEICPSCGGSGHVTCAACGGSGSVTEPDEPDRTVYEAKTEYTEEMVYDPHWKTNRMVRTPHTVTVKRVIKGKKGETHSCYSCGGRGILTCNNCGGTGRIEHYLTPCFQAHSELQNNFSATPREWLEELKKAAEKAVYAHVIENSGFAKAGPLEHKDGKYTQPYTITDSYVCYEFSVSGTDYRLYKFASSDRLLNQYQTLFCDVLLKDRLDRLKKECAERLSSSKALSLIKDLQSIELFRQISEYYGVSQGKNLAEEIFRRCAGFIRPDTAKTLAGILTRLFSIAAPTSDLAWKVTATTLGLLPLWGIYSVCERFEAGIFGTVLLTVLGILLSLGLMFCSRPFAVLIDRFLTYRKRRLLPNGKSIKFKAVKTDWNLMAWRYIFCALVSALAYQFLPEGFRIPTVFYVQELAQEYLSAFTLG